MRRRSRRGRRWRRRARRGCCRRRRRRRRTRRCCRGRGRRRHMRRWGRRRRWRGGTWRGRGGRWRRRRTRRSCGRWRCWPRRRLRLRRLLRRLLRFSVRADFALRRLLLRHNQRRGLCSGLCMRSGTCELHRGQRGRCKQHKTKFGHGDLGSWNHFCDKAAGINKQALGRNVARFKCQFGFISGSLACKGVAVHCVFRRTFQTVPILWRHACFRLSHAARRWP